ncbi:MAG: hypothetical protein AABW67_06010 [Nanoarchaeota archaeon]
MIKKIGLCLGILVISLVLINLVCSEETAGNLTAKGLEDVNLDIKSISEVQTKTTQTLEQTVNIPENLQIVARIIFGISGEISLQIFIVLIAIWIMLLVVITNILKITPFFKGEIIPWIGGFIITLLIALTGTIRSLAVLFFNLGNVFKFLEEWPIIGVVFALIIAIGALWMASIILKIIGNKIGLEDAGQKGRKIGKLSAMAEVADEISHI